MILALITISIWPAADVSLTWRRLPSYPIELGVAGPFVGVHQNTLIVAGGANFPRPVWESQKTWHDQIYVLVKSNGGFAWKLGSKLARPLAYGSAVSTADGIICIGGNDAEKTFRDVFQLKWNPETARIETDRLPSLPIACASGSATMVDHVIYLAGGQSNQNLESATDQLWSLDLSRRNDPREFAWKKQPPMPGGPRAFHIAVHQSNGTDQCIYVIGGRRKIGPMPTDVLFLKDVWEYTPRTGKWRQRADAPRPIMGGHAIDILDRQILVLGGDDGAHFFRADELKDNHPGFPREALLFDAVQNSWSKAGELPQNHVTTSSVRWNDAIVIPTGEIRPRVRTSDVWKIQMEKRRR